MQKKIRSINWKAVKQDASRFLKPRQLPSIEIWSEAFFLNQLQKFT